MKNTRRFLAAVMTLAMVSAFAPMSAVADDSTTLTITKVNPYDELYIITIPANTTIENTGWTDLNALNVKYNGKKSFDPSKMITVTAESANGWKFKSDEADTDIGYTLKSAANDTTATTSWVFSANAVNKNDGTTVVGTSKTIGIDVSAADYEAATAATYSDIITFTLNFHPKLTLTRSYTKKNLENNPKNVIFLKKRLDKRTKIWHNIE